MKRILLINFVFLLITLSADEFRIEYDTSKDFDKLQSIVKTYKQIHFTTMMHFIGPNNIKKLTMITYRSIFNPPIQTMATVNALPTEEEKATMCISSKGFLPGEPVDIIAKDQNNKLLKELRFFPYPITATSEVDNAYTFAKLTSSIPTLYEIELNGFEENEKLSIETICYDEHSEIAKNSTIAIAPRAKGKDGGDCTVIIHRESGEKLQMNLPWGSEFIKYRKG